MSVSQISVRKTTSNREELSNGDCLVRWYEICRVQNIHGLVIGNDCTTHRAYIIL